MILLATLAANVSAQTIYDALRFSENYYEGTARTMAMGNAFTALGGDLGAVTLNPAGSAVARYSQITLSPGVSIPSNTTRGIDLTGEGVYAFEQKIRSTRPQFTLPNIGVTVNFDTHRTSGIKNVTVGFISNVSNIYNNDVFAQGSGNSQNSFMGALAWQATAQNYTNDNLLKDNAWADTDAPWELIAGSQAGLIADIGELLPDNIYVAANENYAITDKEDGGKDYDIYPSGALKQRYGRTVAGVKYDMVFNVGMNISDLVFVGANLGLISSNIRKEKYIIEETLEPSLFYNELDKAKFTTTYDAKSSGIYGKFGVIVTPFAGLRFGAAIQTPTLNVIQESYKVKAEKHCLAPPADESGTLSASQKGESKYDLISPFRFNVGAAYTFGKLAVVSADYEFCNYAKMYFTEAGSSENSYFESTNADIMNFMGQSHMLRLGAELKPIRQFAVRAGFNLTTRPEKVLDENENLGYMKGDAYTVRQASVGIGYISDGSFFFDLACSLRMSDDTYYTYNMSEERSPINFIDSYGKLTHISSPAIKVKNNLWNVVATLGWRF